MSKITENFTSEELSCPCCGECSMDSQFMTYLQGLRELCGFPFVVTSGYRCAKHNAEVSKRSMNDHTRGLAVDISMQNRYHRAILLSNIVKGDYFKDIAIGKTFIHIGKGKKVLGIGVYD